jgi:hypothetical protein
MNAVNFVIRRYPHFSLVRILLKVLFTDTIYARL